MNVDIFIRHLNNLISLEKKKSVSQKYIHHNERY